MQTSLQMSCFPLLQMGLVEGKGGIVNNVRLWLFDWGVENNEMMIKVQ